MAIGISPLVDFAFKLILGSPQHSRVTVHFLNSILVDQPRITDVEILNPFLDKQYLCIESGHVSDFARTTSRLPVA
ncbi:MAG: PD-(D/E)XK nuclease family transposase [Planctomyces sp.]|nr:PD-(D/E)XK nuclease family transposase [Planctomyces sp.]